MTSLEEDAYREKEETDGLTVRCLQGERKN